jgi:hypothetical protein
VEAEVRKRGRRSDPDEERQQHADTTSVTAAVFMELVLASVRPIPCLSSRVNYHQRLANSLFLRFALAAFFLLGRESFDNKYPALRCALSNWPDCRIGGRIVPFARFLYAVESDHNNAVWRFTLK